jgi:hypothetical protein
VAGSLEAGGGLIGRIVVADGALGLRQGPPQPAQ